MGGQRSLRWHTHRSAATAVLTFHLTCKGHRESGALLLSRLSLDISRWHVLRPTNDRASALLLLATGQLREQELWRDFLRDFVVEVVRRPVVAVGNSIGGYISASLAGDYPALVSGERSQA